MQEWWKEEHLAELSKKTSKLKNLHTKWKKGLKVPHFDLGRRFYLCRRKKFGEEGENECDQNGEFSFRRGWKKKSTHSIGSDMWSGDLFLCISVTHLVIFFVLELHSLFLLPSETEAGIFRQILNGDLDFVSEPWPSISENAKELVKQMLDRDPKKRISAHEVLCEFL